MEKLISLSDFVTQESKKPLRKGFKNHVGDAFGFYNRVTKYNNFLKQPLNLGMFVPAKLVKGEWVVLEEPKKPWEDKIMEEGIHFNYKNKNKEYELAKRNVLFEGFEFIKKYPNNCIRFKFKGHFRNVFLDKVNIENLICFDKDGMTLTESAKQKLS